MSIEQLVRPDKHIVEAVEARLCSIATGRDHFVENFVGWGHATAREIGFRMGYGINRVPIETFQLPLGADVRGFGRGG